MALPSMFDIEHGSVGELINESQNLQQEPRDPLYTEFEVYIPQVSVVGDAGVLVVVVREGRKIRQHRC